ncbi:hypothetical protein DLD82_15205 [Methanospirillum stamsii]|uniref:Uncharacterized protein n=1 Tax=Methanospirillum stamsii TaxID=1277351 RepID=A0A2V2MRT1_9EURY|nr:hypothetical protein DLD82_15205 [Methanospirillum stamsii]
MFRHHDPPGDVNVSEVFGGWALLRGVLVPGITRFILIFIKGPFPPVDGMLFLISPILWGFRFVIPDNPQHSRNSRQVSTHLQHLIHYLDLEKTQGILKNSERL